MNNIFPPDLTDALSRIASLQDYSEKWRDAYFAQALILIGRALAARPEASPSGEARQE